MSGGQSPHHRTRGQQSTWSLVATLAVLELVIIIVVVHLFSPSVDEEPAEGSQRLSMSVPHQDALTR